MTYGYIGLVLIIIGLRGLFKVLSRIPEKKEKELEAFVGAINRYNELRRLKGMSHEEADKIVFKEYSVHVRYHEENNHGENK